MYLMDVDQFIITAITPAVLSATDSETPSDQLVFNISKPLLPHQGSIVHLSDHTRPITSFRQIDLNNFDVAYKPPSRSFKERQMFEIGFVIYDLDFASSEPFSMHIAIRPAITTAPRVFMNVGMVLLEGQSRPLRINNLEIVDSDNINDVQIFVTGGLHHGKLEVDKKPAVSFKQRDIIAGSVIYHHDDSDSVRDSIHFRIYDGSYSTHTKFPITIIPKDDNPPSLLVNVGLKVNEGSDVQIKPTVLRAVDHDTSEEYVSFVVIKQPYSGRILKKGIDVHTFTQKDINDGLVYYQHDGSEVFTDVFEVMLRDVSNPPNESPPYEVSISILPVGDDPPKRDPASSFSLEVRETDIGLLSTHHLHYMDVDSHDSEIIYTITIPPRFIGSFAYSDPGKIVDFTNETMVFQDSNLTAVKNFTQEQINHHKIAYVPPSGEIGPNPLYLQFIFSVTDKDNNIVSGQIFNITIFPVNNQIPQLHTGELLVEEGSSTLLSTNELSVYDPDTLTSDLQMSLFTIPLHGSLRRSEQPLRVGDLLSLDDILTLRLEYIHDGSESFKDNFKIGVNDGLHFVSGDVLVLVEPIDDEKPIWKKGLLPRISLNEGGSIQITSQVLAATDVDTEDSSLFFILTEAPLFGSILHHKQKVNRFTQKDVMNGEVLFVHAGQEIGPSPKEDSATFIVTDKALPRLMPYDSHKVSITILPQNTRPPRLYFKRAILVDEGKRSAVTEENLSASDDDTFPGELLIVITKQPEHGYLENLRPAPGYEKSGKNKRITAFPLQDVKSGFITFVQFFHRNIEPESDVFEVFVTDGVHNSTTVLVYVSIVLLNDEVPYFFVANISVNEGDAFIMDNDSISTSDRDYPGDILVISVKSKPKYGTLTHFVQAISNGPLLEIPFNQLAAENFESIVYRHDGSENFFDYFTLSVNDGLHTVLRTCFVEINPVNDESPVLKKNIAAEGVGFLGSFTLSSAVLFSEDVDSTPDEIYFEILSTPKFGVLERKGANTQWKLLDSMKFSQSDINSNLIRYRHTSKLTAVHEDSFNFFLSDGVHNSSLASFVIKFNDDEKNEFSVLNNKASIDPGGELILNSSLLHISTNNSVQDISFVILRPPYYGSLSLKGDVLPVKNFTLFHLKNNLLLYLHNESHKFTNDSFDIMITNGVIMKNLTFNIAISSFTDKFPHLRVLLPLIIDVNNSSSFFITSEHLLASQPLIPIRNITYKIIEKPKFGLLMYHGKIENPVSFSQEDIDKGLITYVPKSNSSFTDQFLFEVANNQEDGYVRNESLTLDPSIFPIFAKNVVKAEDPILVINRPGDLEEVWNQNVGFHINNYNLRVSFPVSSP
ncbi:FRAS1-related extracellular matrix protein 1, partial [Stegodyphus mimosarum]